MAAGVASQEAAMHTLRGNADSVEFCPIRGFENFLAAATYNLVEGDLPQRVGQLYLFEADIGKAPKMQKVHEQATSGIFDLKWSPQLLQGAPCLGQASADGSLSFNLLQTEGSASLESNTTCAVSKAMCLSLDWQPKTAENVVVSQSDGHIALVEVAPDEARLAQAWPAHELEVWVASFDRWDTSLVYSGADDCTLKGWDVRASCDTPVFTNRREHNMGVCTVASDPFREHMFVTGSYDERVRVWDNRVLSRPVCVYAGAQLGGGVWRLKWHPHIPGLLLGACMHGGARILEVEASGEVSVLEEYTAHTSLTYGADWYYSMIDSDRSAAYLEAMADEGCSSRYNFDPQVEGSSKDNETLKAPALSADGDGRVLHKQLQISPGFVATCSFYDRALHLWTPTNIKQKQRASR